MCYDVSFTVQMKELGDYFPDLVYDEQIKMDFEPEHIIGHAYAEHPILYRNREDGLLHCKLMEWGCIPFYVSDKAGFAKQRTTMLNARSEKILNDTKSYWNKIRNRRCLIPVTGFFEHRQVKGFKNKIPYFISLKDQNLFFLPGLYSVAKLADTKTGEVTETFTFTIITRAANATMRMVHNAGTNAGRMPLLLPASKSMEWLQDELGATEYASLLEYEMPDDNLSLRTVYTIRSPKPRPDGKSKIEEFVWENLPDLEF